MGVMANTKGGDVLNKKRKKPAPMLVFSLRIDEKTLKILKKLARKEEGEWLVLDLANRGGKRRRGEINGLVKK